MQLRDAHLNLLRKATAVWAPVEAGAPAVMMSPLEAGGGEDLMPGLYADLAQRAGLETVDEQQVDALVTEMPEALAQLLAHGVLEEGTYSYDNPLADLPFAANMLPDEIADLAHEKVVSFAFTSQHAALLRNARWRGLFMNPKRPYGDMSYFELDMAAILGEPAEQDAEGRLSEEQSTRLWQLHVETLPALQLYLQKASITPGEYASIAVEGSLF